MKTMLATAATPIEAYEKAAGLRRGREINVTPEADGTYVIAEERCPSCDHDLASPGLRGHTCYSYARWHANQKASAARRATEENSKGQSNAPL